MYDLSHYIIPKGVDKKKYLESISVTWQALKRIDLQLLDHLSTRASKLVEYQLLKDNSSLNRSIRELESLQLLYTMENETLQISLVSVTQRGANVVLFDQNNRKDYVHRTTYLRADEE
jgi:hypothetical protein